MARGSVLNELDDRALLNLVGDVIGLLDLEELHRGMLQALLRALPSDYASLNDIGPEPEQIVTVAEPRDQLRLLDRWVEVAHENPLLRRYQQTQDGRAYRFSDVIEQEQLHELAIYRDFYALMGVEHQMAFILNGSPNRVLAIALSRGERDYSDTDRDFADRARPFLIQVYRNAIAYGAQGGQAPAVDALRGLGLTRREAEVLRLLAVGSSNEHIALALGISSRTVGKHLENSFRKLDVPDRSTAAARVWTLAGGSGAVR
jgi:DNA-binding CsgD family transcriptional regulator